MHLIDTFDPSNSILGNVAVIFSAGKTNSILITIVDVLTKLFQNLQRSLP